MPQYRLYISDDEDRALREVARRTGQRPLDTLRTLVQQLTRDEKILAIDPFLRRVLAQNDALYSLLTTVASEIGFVSGAFHFSAKGREEMTTLATSKQADLERAAEAIKQAADMASGGRRTPSASGS